MNFLFQWICDESAENWPSGRWVYAHKAGCLLCREDETTSIGMRGSDSRRPGPWRVVGHMGMKLPGRGRERSRKGRWPRSRASAEGELHAMRRSLVYAHKPSPPRHGRFTTAFRFPVIAPLTAAGCADTWRDSSCIRAPAALAAEWPPVSRSLRRLYPVGLQAPRTCPASGWTRRDRYRSPPVATIAGLYPPNLPPHDHDLSQPPLLEIP